MALTAADRVDVINDAGEGTASITLPAGSLPTNICIGGAPADELFVTAAHAESLLRIRSTKPVTRPSLRRLHEAALLRLTALPRKVWFCRRESK